MDATLAIEAAVGRLTGHAQGHALDAGFVAGLDVNDLARDAVALHPALVHAEEHFGPVAGFSAARAGVDGQEGRVVVKLAAQELLELEFREVVDERVVFSLEFLKNGGLRIGIGFLAGEFAQNFEIRGAALDAAEGIDDCAQARDFPDVLLRGLPAVPEVRGGHAALDFVEPAGKRGQVKDTSATPRRGG